MKRKRKNNESYFYFDSFNNPSDTYIAFTGPLGNIEKIAGSAENKYEYNEIAQELNLELNTVKTRIKRAKEMLKKHNLL